MNLKGFVIGEASRSTDDCQVVIIANSKCLGLLVDARSCQVVAAGFHAYATELQKKYSGIAMMSNEDVFGLSEQPIDAKMKRAQSLVGTSEGRPSDDWYPTPIMATEALLRVEQFSGSVLEPACGDGAISRVMEARGFVVKSTDLIDRGYGQTPYDFVSKDYPFKADNIITNPPFSLAQEFIEYSLERATEKVVMLGKLQLLESAKRKTLFETTPLEKVWVFSKRITMARNGEYEKYSSSMICFAWFVWNHKYKGEPKIGWI